MWIEGNCTLLNSAVRMLPLVLRGELYDGSSGTKMALLQRKETNWQVTFGSS
jgi:hypothetical protein